MTRSARSIPTGVGSRGGIGHAHHDDPDAWNARARRWRANSPAYRERERLRSASRRARRNDDRAEVLFTDVIRSLMSRASTHQMGRALLIDHTAVWRILNDGQEPSGATIDAVVAVFGPSEVLREWRCLRALDRDRREVDDLVTRLDSSTSRSSRQVAA